jgi:hypothetical protein
MHSDTQKSMSVYGFLLLAAVIITAVVAFVLVPEAGRNQKFWLSLTAIIAAEAFTFVFPIAIMRRGAAARRILPFHFGTGTMIVIYDIGVLALCFAALLPIAFPILLAAQLIWFLCFLTFVGAATVGGMYISTQDTTDSACRIPFTDMQDRLASLNNRLAMIPTENVAQVKRELARVCEDAKYLSRDSLVGAESVETEITQCLDNIGQEVLRMENVSTPTSGNDRTPIDPKNCAQAIENEIQRLRQFFAKRDALLKRLRQAKG